MHLEIDHNCSQQEAIQRLDGFLEMLLQQSLPGHVKIQDANRNWIENVMQFSFTARKGFFTTTIQGGIEVTKDRLILDSSLPVVLTAFLGEEKVKNGILQHLRALFQQFTSTNPLKET